MQNLQRFRFPVSVFLGNCRKWKSSGNAFEINIPVPWGHVAGKWWGDPDSKPLLGLHGWQDNAATFDGIAPLLPKNVSLLALDLPGHGFSSWYPYNTCYNSSQGLLVLRQVVKYFEWDKISILGHSMGGAYGFLYAAVFPDDVDKLIMLDMARPMAISPNQLVLDAQDIIQRCLKNNHMSLETGPRFTYDELVSRLFKGYRGSLTEESCRVLLKRGAVKMPCGKYSFSRDPRLNSTTSDLSAFPLSLIYSMAENIKCEVLNLKGKSGVNFISEKDYHNALQFIRKSAKKFEFHEVDGTHHFHLNEPSAAGSLIAQFLDV
ncbi:probable serine hydrolase isoform X2 [Ischnura elegans]|uniref:probable serine hydrolase isoform X2 n=1 Tax=Ischnura elegans TaxID=197161 RepID=UPI001ED87D00|nr:probable serine hydrolase isoform X2 [Ischnura elegans]